MDPHEEIVSSAPFSYSSSSHTSSQSTIDISEQYGEDTLSELPETLNERRNGISPIRETQSLSDINAHTHCVTKSREKSTSKLSLSEWFWKKMNLDASNTNKSPSLWATLRRRRNKSCESLPSIAKIEGKQMYLKSSENLEGMRKLGVSCPDVPTGQLENSNPSGVSIWMSKLESSTSKRSGLKRAASFTSSTSKLLRKSLRAAKKFLRAKANTSSSSVQKPIKRGRVLQSELENEVLHDTLLGASGDNLSKRKAHSCLDVSFTGTNSLPNERSRSAERGQSKGRDVITKSKTLSLIRNIGKKSVAQVEQKKYQEKTTSVEIIDLDEEPKIRTVSEHSFTVKVQTETMDDKKSSDKPNKEDEQNKEEKLIPEMPVTPARNTADNKQNTPSILSGSGKKKGKKSKTVIKVQSSKKERTDNPISAPSDITPYKLLDTNLDGDEEKSEAGSSKVENVKVEEKEIDKDVTVSTPEKADTGDNLEESSCTESFSQYQPFMYDSAGTDLEGKRERLYKVLVVGELGAGKTSIIKRYVHQFFSQHYRATIGVDFALKVLRWDPDTVIRLQLWDIAGQERFGSMTRVYYKEAVGAFVVFDVTRASTLEAVPKWKQDLDSKVVLPDGSPIPTVLLANKSDQPKEGIAADREKMNEFCQQQGFSAWFETSAKDNINIDESSNFLVSKILEMDRWSQEPVLPDPEKIDITSNGKYTPASSGNCAC